MTLSDSENPKLFLKGGHGAGGWSGRGGRRREEKVNKKTQGGEGRSKEGKDNRMEDDTKGAKDRLRCRRM